jgi:WD40 repeat protein
MKHSLAVAFLAFILGGPSNGQEPTLRKTLSGHQRAVNAVAFAPLWNAFASASDDKTVILWDLKTGSPLATLKLPSPVLSVAFDESGLRLVAGCQDGTVKIYNLFTGKNTATIRADLPARKVGVTTFWKAWLGRNYVGVTYPAKDRPTDGDDVWDLNTGKKVPLVIISNTMNLDVHTASDIGWANANEEPHYPEQPVSEGEISFTRRPPIYGPVQFPVAFRGHTGRVLSLAFSPQGGKWLLSGSSDKTIKVWSTSTGRCVATLTHHRDAVTCLEFSPDGRTLASASADATIKLWDMPKELKD